ncbi:MAG: 16S rRNA (guanine(527)-N(7))-methyltransferase RsmG [Clostridia bacterium]|nr:16S rRNA (guanine(527)-N(7))-methyltransferase RsmG [Clostridia bacterium]
MLNEKDFTAELMRVFKANGLGKLLGRDTAEKLYALTEFMLAENEKYNLTAIKEPKAIILNHYADCITLSEHLSKGASVIDVGCGAGFPTLPLALVRPDLKITALDATAKRVAYVESAARLIGLANVTPVCRRAEDLARLGEYRERFDFATARAVAEMRVLCELCMPFVKVGGKMIAMKGKNAAFELSGAAKAISLLGGKRATTVTVKLQGEELLEHPLIIVEKQNKTPSAYPRVFAQISKKPL